MKKPKSLKHIFRQSLRLFAMTGLLSLGIATANAQTFTDLYNFSSGNGELPTGSLVLSSSGTVFYGMTQYGGAHDMGCVFSIHTDGTGYTDILDFNGTNGLTPCGSLTLSASGSVLYGMTLYGGEYYSLSNNSYGVIFSVNTNGTSYKSASFASPGISGQFPFGSLTLVGSTLYGMTYEGGSADAGCIFSISTSLTGYTDLLNFSGTTGGQPSGSLTYSGGVLYGTTGGNIFSYNITTHAYNNLHSLSGEPLNDLIISGGVLYGIVSSGSIFSYNTNTNTYATLYSGLYSGYYYNHNDLSISGSTLYGISLSSGGAGYIFTISTNGTGYTDLYNFTFSPPSGEPVPSIGNFSLLNDAIYGTIPVGGTGSIGELFSLSGIGLCTLSISIPLRECTDELIVDGEDGVSPYTYLWEPGGATTNSIYGTYGTTYTVTVTDNNGCTATTSLSPCGFGGGAVIKATKRGVFNNINQQEGDGSAQLTEILAYPNPNKGQFSISGLQSGMFIQMYDYTGRLVSTIIANEETMQVNMANQANGIYLIRILSQDGALIKQTKVIKTL